MNSQIPVYHTHQYPFSYPPRVRDGFKPWIHVDMNIFVTPEYNTLSIHSYKKTQEMTYMIYIKTNNLFNEKIDFCLY